MIRLNIFRPHSNHRFVNIVLTGLIATLIINVASAHAPTEEADTDKHARKRTDKDAAIHSILTDASQDGEIIGLAAAVVRNGEVTLLEGYGRRALDSDQTVDANTVFRIASLSKGMAASLASQLVQEGKLSLDAPAKGFAPAFRLKNGAQLNQLTLEHVLSHRTSLPPYAYDNLLEAGTPPTDILRAFGKVDPICPVGKCYAYQNVAFNVIANAVEARGGQSYAQAIKTRLFEPLHMARASVGRQALQKDDNWARPHRRKRGSPWRKAPVKTPYYDVPAAGGVNASISDMAQWLRAQMGHAPSVLSQEVLALTHTPRVATPAEMRRMRTLRRRLRSAHYGLGWRIYDYAGTTVVNHSGSVDGGYAAQIAFLPEHDVGFVLLTNARSRSFFGLLPQFLDLELNLETADAP